MTVAELIVELQKQPQELHVALSVFDHIYESDYNRGSRGALTILKGISYGGYQDEKIFIGDALKYNAYRINKPKIQNEERHNGESKTG